MTADVWTDVRFWSLVINEGRRTILCSPENESRIKGLVDAHGIGGVITVEVSPHVPDDRVYLLKPRSDL